jgi:hypothetical protein
VKFEVVGPPILTASCYCTSCQEAGRRFEQLASAPPVLDSDSGTGLILYRKDRVQCMILKTAFHAEWNADKLLDIMGNESKILIGNCPPGG